MPQSSLQMQIRLGSSFVPDPAAALAQANCRSHAFQYGYSPLQETTFSYEAINDPETPSDSISLNRPFELLPLVNKFTGAWGPPHDLYQHQGKHYIILFPGYFNPPHVGHMELLKAAFKRCWALNLVGAIIAPAEDDDTQLRSACDGQATFVLPASQRAELWRQSRVPPDRVWVFDGAPQRLRRIKGRMGEIAWRRDLDIEFILLRGPESLREIPQLTDWGCATAITSDVSQPASYRLPYSLLPLDGCGPWGVAVRGLFGLVVVGKATPRKPYIMPDDPNNWLL
ncbi:Histone chaperone [Purpureocillium lavendulum]|uniref:Histone chaperone n=1 Tax=Purpureocillium lavendulum TaxID=1247861 RepID=A0AB34FMT0_9HYPO|nr:Histone chaperone [Purpureocillium lavendulum]